MENLNETPPPPEYIQQPYNIKQSYKKKKEKKIYTTPLVKKAKLICNINSKNQKKKLAKQLARQLFKLNKKISNMLF